MGVGAIIAGIGVAASVAGTVVGFAGQQQQVEASKRAEQLRMTQMNLDASRAKRETVRRTMLARAQAESTATNQGAGNSSSLEGALGQISNQGGRSLLATTQNQTIGQGIFKANMDEADGQSTASLGQGLGSLGGMFINNSGSIGRAFGFA